MPNRHNAEPSSNARVRRQAHLERDREIKERKRLRRRRGEIHAAMTAASFLIAASQHDAVESASPYSYKATDQKRAGNGWEILRYDDTNDSISVFGYSGSRDKARAWAREMNENPESAPVKALTPDQAMLSLGFERVMNNGRNGGLRSAHVEKKFRKVSA